MNKEQSIPDYAAAMYTECRQNVGLYDSPSGIEVPPLDGPEYRVTYWPPSPDSPERLSVSYGPLGAGGRSFYISTNSITKNTGEHAKLIPGGAFYDKADDAPMEDLDEAARLLQLIKAAHRHRAINS